MDNNYYTGATLIRGSHHVHPNSVHGHYSPGSTGGGATGTSLAGPPLLMQPRVNNKNLFSGAPLIRNNGSLNNGTVVSVPSNVVPTQLHAPPQQQPPGVICCFQPVYYVPMMQNPTNMHTSPPQLSLPPAPMKKLNQQIPKRRNYKSLQISKSPPGPPITPSTTTSPGSSAPVIPSTVPPTNVKQPTRYLQSQLSTSISSTPKSNFLISDNRHLVLEEGNTSPVDNIFSNSNLSSSDDSELNFQSVIESTRYLISNEEKQRSDKLLNFYFYDEHWRPRESETSSSSSELSSPTSTSSNIHYGTNSMSRRMSCQDIDNDWMNHNQDHNHLNVNDNLHGLPYSPRHNYSSTDRFLDLDETTVRIRQGQINGSEPKGNNNSSSLSASAMVIKKKDLEVEAQIVTLANGHRDLEIHLCYVTS